MRYTKKIYKAYVGYGKHPLADSEMFVRISQNRKKWQGKPVNKLYRKERKSKTSYVSNKHLLMTLVNNGMSYEDAIKLV